MRAATGPFVTFGRADSPRSAPGRRWTPSPPRWLSGVEPAKLKPGYANFAIDEPPLSNLSCNSPGHGQAPRSTIFGVEVESADHLDQARQRLERAGLDVVAEAEACCCYARQAKVWAGDRAAWEFYTVLADLETLDGQPSSATTTP